MPQRIVYPALRRAFALLFVTTIALATPCLSAPWSKIVVGQQSESERLATIDLQRYITQVTGKKPTVISAVAWRKKPGEAVILGSPTGNSLLKNLALPKKQMGDQGYYLANEKLKGRQVVIAAGLTSEGATNAIYGLLRELGFGFYLGSEAIPASFPTRLKTSPVVRKPVFSVRGVLPWYNFFNSPTTWDPEDHRALVDQLIRMGANFVGFHTYDHEPFAAYEENGKMRGGARLLSTSSPNWGCRPLATQDFAFGTDKLFADKYFGARTTLIADPDEAIRREEAVMDEAIRYAKRRGLRTCLGFEVYGNPFDPSVREGFLKRFNRMISRYPALDYVWIWQQEAQGLSGCDAQPDRNDRSGQGPGSMLARYALARKDIFKRITGEGKKPFPNSERDRLARANEAARLEQFSRLAYRALQRYKNHPRLVISGWGGDDRLLSADYYEGLDKLLPKDVVFSSLDFIVPRPRVDGIYGELPSSRERWPIPWLEYDGDQWHPQPAVHTYEGLTRDAHKKGSQGILGIHWRTRDVEENFAYLVQYAWQPNLTAELFFKDYAMRCYDAAIAAQMSKIHSDLDNLGYRWVGGNGQIECGGFGWGPGEEGKAKKLTELRAKAASLLPKAGRSAARLKWLIASMDWVLAFREAEMQAVEVEKHLAEASAANPDRARLIRRILLTEMNSSKLANALRTYAERITTKGEYGVLATINTKAVMAWRDLETKRSGNVGESSPEDMSPTWKPTPQIILPRFHTSALEYKPLELEPIVLGGKQAWLHYRMLGGKSWTTAQLQPVKGWVYRAIIPARVVTAPGLEIKLSFSGESAATPSYGPIAITVVPYPSSLTEPRKKVTQAPTALKLNYSEGSIYPVELTWNDLPQAEYYAVFRDGQKVAETCAPMFPDAPGPTASYTVEARAYDFVLATSKPLQVAVPDRATVEEFTLKASANSSGVTLNWPASTCPYTATYAVSRSRAGESEVSLASALAFKSSTNLYWDSPPPGEWTYTVRPVNASGIAGAAHSVEIAFAPRGKASPAIDLPLNNKPEISTVVGRVDFGTSGAMFNGGHIILPHQPEMNLNQGMTLDFEFKADTTNNMPVLLCHGAYTSDGWFVQILGGSFIIRAPGGDAVGPAIDPGKWYAIRFVYDGANFRLYVDGKKIDQKPVWTQDTPTNRNLIIGQYESVGPDYSFKGVIRNIKIYSDALPD